MKTDSTALFGEMLGSYEQGKVSRRQFGEAGSMLAASAALPAAALAADPLPAPIVSVSVNHIALGVSDLKRSKEWYMRILKLKVIQENDHFALLQFGNTQLVMRSPTKEHSSVVPGTINHFQFGVSPYDEAALEATLIAQGLTPKKDLESFLVRDPDNLLVQIGDERMGIDKGYLLAST